MDRRERLLARLVNVQGDIRRALAHDDRERLAVLEKLHGEIHDQLIQMDARSPERDSR
jgi:hypothetical protein